MKRFFSFLLAALLLIFCCACGGNPEPAEDTPDDSALLLDGTTPDEADDDGYIPDDEGGGIDLPELSEASASSNLPDANSSEGNAGSDSDMLPENGSYTTKDDVAAYINTYGHLPDNFITKKEAQALGWSGGSLEPYAPGKCIGGSRFGNYEGLLPKDRNYTECDIDTLGAGSRGAKRIVFSDDGLIYYTDDHYESFTLLYGEE